MKNFMSGNGKNSDVVMSSKVRIARNLEDAPFPSRMSKDIRKSTTKKIYAAIKNSSFAGDFDMVDLITVSDSTAYSYADKHLISDNFARNKDNSSFLLSKDKDVSIMICEEDHIRIWSMKAGQDIYAAYEKADNLDDVFINNLKVAFDENLGFLTAVPTNLGTGMKASFDLHLFAIEDKGMIPRLASMVGKLGMSLTPVFSGKGAFYRLSNQISLGISEKAALDNLNAICDQIVKQERGLREYYREKEDFEDKVYRALGTLTMARKLEFDELVSLLSLVRVGISLSLLNTNYETVGELLYTLSTATITADSNLDISHDDTLKLRASIVREKLK